MTWYCQSWVEPLEIGSSISGD